MRNPIRTALHGHEIGLGIDRELIIKSGKVRATSGDPVDFPDGAVGVGGAGVVNALDHGVVGDGTTDDVDHIEDLLNEHLNAGRTVLFPPRNYRVSRPMVHSYSDVVFQGHGILGYGARLRPDFTGASNHCLEISLASMNTPGVISGFFCLGLTIEPSTFDTGGHGIYCSVPQNDRWFTNFVFRDCLVRGMGEDGIHMTGSVFEATIDRCITRQNGNNGITLGHDVSEVGQLSTIDVENCILGGNGQHGLHVINNAYDVRVRDGYALLNGQNGVNFSNGITLIDGMGFENNGESAAAGAFGTGYAGIAGATFATIRNCKGHNGAAQFRQKGLIDIYAVGNVTIDDCVMTTESNETYLATVTGNGRFVRFYNTEDQFAFNKIVGTPADHKIWSINDRLTSYVKTAMPTATDAEQLYRTILVSNETGGAVPAFCDGTNWRRVTDRAIVS